MTPVLELHGVVKGYGALRPLRIERLTVALEDRVALVGLDQPAAEVLINLVTGATLPDRGDVHLFGRPTAAIENSAEWLSLVDRFGIVSERAVLLDAMTVVQNLAMPFSLEIEPPPAEIRARAESLAGEARVPQDLWDRAVGELDAGMRVRVRVARALALDPAVLLLEHPSASVARRAVSALGRDIGDVVSRRRTALLALTADETFARSVAAKVLTHEPASGRLHERRRWFG